MIKIFRAANPDEYIVEKGMKVDFFTPIETYRITFKPCGPFPADREAHQMLDVCQSIRDLSALLLAVGSFDPLPTRIGTHFDVPFRVLEYLKQLYAAYKLPPPLFTGARENPRPHEQVRAALKGKYSDDVMLGFSGGKDSILHYLKWKEMGRRVYPVRINGLIKSLDPTEWQATGDIMRALSDTCSLIPIKTNLPRQLKDIPTLHQIFFGELACMALTLPKIPHILSVGLPRKYHRVLDRTPYLFYEIESVNHLYLEILKELGLNFRYELAWEDEMSDEYSKAICDNWSVIQYASSCNIPHRFRATYRSRNQKKYGIEFPKYLCGVCTSCLHIIYRLLLFGTDKQKKHFGRQPYLNRLCAVETPGNLSGIHSYELEMDRAIVERLKTEYEIG